MDPREEGEIFRDLQSLCQSPGYIHVLARLCYINNFIRYKRHMTTKVMEQQYTRSHLVRTEIATLLGLLIKGEINTICPEPIAYKELKNRTEQLLEELHNALLKPMADSFKKAIEDGEFSNEFSAGHMLREAIFYGGETAYAHQYRDFSLLKYSKDETWLINNKGFTSNDVAGVMRAIVKTQEHKASVFASTISHKEAGKNIDLIVFTFMVEEIVKLSGIDSDIVERVILAMLRILASHFGLQAMQELPQHNPPEGLLAVRAMDSRSKKWR